MKRFLIKIWKFAYRFLIAAFLVGIVFVLVTNGYVRVTAKDKIVSVEKASELKDVDCIIVLGCLVKPDGEPSHMLSDRLQVGLDAYMKGVAPKIIMSGDHGTEEYDEVNAMKQYAIDFGIPSEDVFMDHAGFSTYESMYRAKEVFGAKKVVIISQEYHLLRSIYIAEKLGMEAYGIPADLRTYVNQTQRDVREFLARSKDFVKCVFKPEPTYLGEKISLKGSGNVTND